MFHEAVVATHSITVTVNGIRRFLDVPSNLTLLEMLRERLALTGAKGGCETGECGACTVLLNGEPVNACLVLAVEANRGELVTIEGLATRIPKDALIDAFVRLGALQCGYCTPGMIIVARAFLDDVVTARLDIPAIDGQVIRSALSGNICRCTGYVQIVKAVLAAAEQEGLPCVASNKPAWKIVPVMD